MAEVVVAFDPGPHTGVAILILRAPQPDAHGDILPVDYSVSRLETLTEPQDVAALYRSIHRRIAEPLNATVVRPTVVCESFTTFSGMIASQQEGIITQRLVGFIEGTCAMLGCPFVLQTPASRKPYEVMARAAVTADLNHPTVHELSALSHALRYVLTGRARS